MGSSNEKQTVVVALLKHLSLDTAPSANYPGSDLESLCTNIMKQSLYGDALLKDDELMKWVKFAESFLENPSQVVNNLSKLNEDLISKTVVLGNGLKHSAADVIVFSAVHPYLISLQKSDQEKLPHLLRWADYIQSKEVLGNLFEKVLVEKVPFELPYEQTYAIFVHNKYTEQDKFMNRVFTITDMEVEVSKSKKAVQEANKVEVGSKAKKNSDGKKNKAEVAAQSAGDKKSLPKKESEKKEEELSVSLLKIQIGHIRKASKHPSADSLLVEEIDIGEAKCRQVVSGLAKYSTPEELTNKRVVLITNVKPGKLRDVMSEGLVLCASNHDHTVVEPLVAPEGAKIGECVTFSGHDGKPEDVLNPKKKQLDKITPHLLTDDNGIATFKGIPFMTSSGPCTSSITNASIK